VWSCADGRLEPFAGQELREVTLLEWRPSGLDLAAGTVAVESPSMRVVSMSRTVLMRTVSMSVRLIRISCGTGWVLSRIPIDLDGRQRSRCPEEPVCRAAGPVIGRAGTGPAGSLRLS
jgi:hypothetical protein